jgi:hypothetical protein
VLTRGFETGGCSCAYLKKSYEDNGSSCFEGRRGTFSTGFLDATWPTDKRCGKDPDRIYGVEKLPCLIIKARGGAAVEAARARGSSEGFGEEVMTGCPFSSSDEDSRSSIALG